MPSGWRSYLTVRPPYMEEVIVPCNGFVSDSVMLNVMVHVIICKQGGGL